MPPIASVTPDAHDAFANSLHQASTHATSTSHARPHLPAARKSSTSADTSGAAMRCTLLTRAARWEALSSGGREASAAAVARLWWGDAPAARRLGQFDLIVGADVVYASDSVLGHGARELSFAGLLCTYWLLAHENTTVVMTYKNRNQLEARFFELSRLHFEVGRLPQIAIPGVPESREDER